MRLHSRRSKPAGTPGPLGRGAGAADQAQSLAPERAAAHAYNLAVALDQSRRYEDALRMYRQALQIGGAGIPVKAIEYRLQDLQGSFPDERHRNRRRTGCRTPMRLGDRLQHMGLVLPTNCRSPCWSKRNRQTAGRCADCPGFCDRGGHARSAGPDAGAANHPVAVCSGRFAGPPAPAQGHGDPLPGVSGLVFTRNADPGTGQPQTQRHHCRRPDPCPCGLGVIISWRLASAADVLAAIDQFYGYELSIDGIIQESRPARSTWLRCRRAGGYSHPVVRLVDAMLSDGVHKLASDIHFEPEGQFLRIRYRIDGVLRQVRVLHGRYWSAMLVRLKLVAGMNIAESRAPQDGRVSLSIGGRNVDFRAAVQPTIHGENFVLRVLDAKRGIVDYDKLGLTDRQYDILNLMLARPEGIILVTGPTGRARRPRYSVLSHMNEESVNIMTLEDPVEYPITRIRQTSISDGSKIDFSDGVRSLMRQDPDIILVGEVRDKDTAEMAFRAAMTGHQVFSTLHTNSALRSFQRIKDLGVSPEVMAATSSASLPSA